MNAEELYGSRYLTAADIQDAIILTIVEVGLEDWQKSKMKGKRPQATLVFDKVKKPMIVNKTNSKILIKDLGSDTDEWVGAKVMLTCRDVDFGDETVKGLRITKVWPAGQVDINQG